MPQRHTKQKDIILAALCRLNNHPTADAVYEEVRSAYPTISRSTVFRVLNQMAENRLVGKVIIPGAADCFDPHTAPHFHGRCRICRKILDIPANPIPLEQLLPEEPEHFSVTGFSLIFDGVCDECRRKGSDSEHG